MTIFTVLQNMKQLIHILVLLPLIVNAQTEQWDTYMARLGGKPASVLVDMGAMSNAPENLLPYLVVTGPKTKHCNKKTGLPETAEIEKMEQVLEVTTAFLTGVTARKLTGTLTYNCERLNYYYVQDTFAVRNALVRMYTKNYPGYEYTIKIKHEPQWLTYRTFLYPDSVAAAWMSDNKQLTAMLQGGDNLSQPRDVIHTLYFTSDTGRTAFIRQAEKMGYTLEKTFDAGTVALPYELTIKRNATVKMENITAMEAELKEAAKTYNGYYKKWEAPLNK